MANCQKSVFIAATIIHFKDGGLSEITVLQTGTKEECDFVCANIHAIAYSGSRPFDNAQAFVMEIEPSKPIANTANVCPTCEEIKTKYKGFGPRHDGSRYCESGSIASGGTNAHCSCDLCF